MTAITFIGMGEAASAIVSGWGGNRRGHVSAYDIKLDEEASGPGMRERCETLGVRCRPTSAAAVADADLILCTVTADQAVRAAESAAPHLRAGALWCDLNSVAPSAKREAAAIVERAGARYLDVAVMAPVYPKLNMVPLLVSGPQAEEGAALLAELPMAPRVVSGEVGAASSIKMIRSVMVKGIEALTVECMLAAVAAGVEDEVLGSLQSSHPGWDWRAKSAYNLERVLTHGARREAEMREVVRTLADLGLPNDTAEATAGWMGRMAASGVTPPTEPTPDDLAPLAERLIESVRRQTH